MNATNISKSPKNTAPLLAAALQGATAVSTHSQISNLPKSSKNKNSKSSKPAQKKKNDCKEKVTLKAVPKKDLKTAVKDLIKENPGMRPKRLRQNPQICAVCSIGFNTPRDKEIMKDGKHNWVGCNFENCTYWGHSLCLGIDGEKSLVEIDLLCPRHKN